MLPPNLARALAKGTVMSCGYFGCPYFSEFFLNEISDLQNNKYILGF